MAARERKRGSSSGRRDEAGVRLGDEGEWAGLDIRDGRSEAAPGSFQAEDLKNKIFQRSSYSQSKEIIGFAKINLYNII